MDENKDLRIMKKLKIVIVGGGSYSWAPKLVRDMMLTETLVEAEYVLLDIKQRPADLVARFLRKLAHELGVRADFTPTIDRRQAFTGADYVIIAISTGGLDAMAHDVSIPEAYGIYHTVGDTSGPGGWARFFRNYPVFADLARDLNRWAPGAPVLNYTNPMTTLTDVLCRLCHAPVIGLCHGLFENLRFLKTYYKVEDEADLSVRYAGLNHFFWITAIHYRGRDLLANLKKRLARKGFSDLLRDISPDPMGFKSHRELATALYRWTGVMPYLGDRHTCEFFAPYITSKKTMRAYKLIRTSMTERRRMIADRKRDITAMTKGSIPDHFRTRSRETAADIITAHATGRPFVDVGNVPNAGQITNLPMGTVVETPVQIDAAGFTPLATGALPERVIGWVEPYARVFNVSVQAALENDRALALYALRLDPVCARLDDEQVTELGQRLLKVHRVRFAK